MRVRKVVTRRGRRFRGYFASSKMGDTVHWESLLEKDALLLLELSPGVAAYQEQPEVIEYFDGEQFREYIPDLKVVLLDGTIRYIEVKPFDQLARPSIRKKYEAIALHFQSIQSPYRIVTEVEIRREPLFSNLQLLAYAHAHPWHEQPTDFDLRMAFQGQTKLPLSAVQQFWNLGALYRMIATGRLSCNLELPLDGFSSIGLPEGGRDETIYL
ncbi:hypothetical protein HA050_14410 [Iodobacter sp. HSC-16F04]|uniref:TnsA endonuclease N-terminal domain-containing protein n=1 Tax=Iodobacter violaceini TaxID=3044271 RepID=A0ABX0KTX5_9NEIS|nr:TnsA endonuclease N-terminal domain-containing protein [Iodobacter violacea]NHQ87306.1 hypothetical protein [Iodobacter violacea]